MSPPQPLCAVLLPRGEHAASPGGPAIDFEALFEDVVAPAVATAGLLATRAALEEADEPEGTGVAGRMLLCELAVVDLTLSRPATWYLLGLRDALRPGSTVTLTAGPPPRGPVPGLPPPLCHGTDPARLRDALAARLTRLLAAGSSREGPDRALVELLGRWRPGRLARVKTDVFRNEVRIRAGERARLAAARADRAGGAGRLREIQRELGGLGADRAAVAVDLMLSYRALDDWTGMIELFDALPEVLRGQVLFREQAAFALGRRGAVSGCPADPNRALKMLEAVLAEQGPSAETCGLLGRIHKDRWEQARAAAPEEARWHLRRAIDAYRRGFDSDIRDTYPGVNALTLLDVEGSAASLAARDRLLPVVHHALGLRLAARDGDYFDRATALELAVLEGRADEAERLLEAALGSVREGWEAATTARNLRLIERARDERSEDAAWIGALAAALEARA